MNRSAGRMTPQFPTLGPTTKLLMGVLFGVHIVFLAIVRQGWFGEGAATFVLDNVLLHAPDGPLEGRVWQVVTYMWVHDPSSIMHLLFNLLMIFFFAPLFERLWGRRDLIRFFILCGIGGGVINELCAIAAPGFFGGQVLGASAAALGLVTAFGLRFPDQNIYLFFILPIPGRAIIPLTLAIDLLVRLTGDPIAIAAHWGGMLTAWLLISGNWRPRRLRAWLTLLRRRRRRGHLDVVDGGRGPWVN